MPLFWRPMSQISQNHLVKGVLVLWNTVPAVKEA